MIEQALTGTVQPNEPIQRSPPKSGGDSVTSATTEDMTSVANNFELQSETSQGSTLDETKRTNGPYHEERAKDDAPEITETSPKARDPTGMRSGDADQPLAPVDPPKLKSSSLEVRKPNSLSNIRRAVSVDNAELLRRHDYRNDPPLLGGSGGSMDDVSVASSPALSNADDLYGFDNSNSSGVARFPDVVMGILDNPNLEDDSPAAEALRANAEVHVRKLGKFARRMNAQAVRKLVKHATFRARSGNVRGKPPRVPPSHRPVDGALQQQQQQPQPTSQSTLMYALKEEDENDLEGDMDSSLGSEHNQNLGVAYTSSVSKAGDPSPEFIIENEALKAEQKQVASEKETRVPREVVAGTVETGKKLLASADPHDILQNNRWRRRRKRGSKDNRKSYVKGKVIDGQHELYALSLAMILGVQTSIGNTNTKINGMERRWLTTDDFMSTEKYEFKPAGGDNTPAHQLGHTFKFKDYSPVAFAYLRRLFGINEFDFLLSICGNANFIEFISNAKSGQFFFYSRDGRFMVKTMTNAESKFLRRILPHYFRHCSQNPNTLLTKFLGMYRVKMYHLRRNVKFVIMNSVYTTDKYLQSFFDLKGSVTGREAKPHQDVKKDNDLRRSLPNGALALYPKVRERMRLQIKSDCYFMRRMKIMDYSMLIGVHHIPPRPGLTSDTSIGQAGFRFSSGRQASTRLRDLVMKRDSRTVSDGQINSSKRSRDEGSTIGGSDLTTPSRDDFSSSMKPWDHSLRFGMLADFDDDDDNSYLEGAEKNPTIMTSARGESLHIREQTIEQVYWPFHRLWDINGHRQMESSRCGRCDNPLPCGCPSDENPMGLNLKFAPPLSDRKDGGLMMDTAGFDMPMMFRNQDGLDRPYVGKIFYMGIIDILQQYNIRKRIEARYRRARGTGWHDASCVHPNIYAERFLKFFDEYSTRVQVEAPLQEGEEQVEFKATDADGEEEKTEIEPVFAQNDNANA